ncbi:MAG: RNA 2',3'-cyclic phosphodiesterase [Roseiflexaceae bacterium]
MTRLFTAINPPAEVAEQLAGITPQLPGLRALRPRDLHITLHFIGEAETTRVAQALEAVAVPAFALSVAGVAQVPITSGGFVLWASVGESAGLLALHVAMAAALAPLGFRPEARRYAPHITLAYCDPDTPAEPVAQFLAQHAGLSLPGLPATHFGLYSSTTASDSSPNYQCERLFVLGAGG